MIYTYIDQYITNNSEEDEYDVNEPSYFKNKDHSDNSKKQYLQEVQVNLRAMDRDKIFNLF